MKKPLTLAIASVMALTSFGAATVPAAAQFGFSVQGPAGGFSVNAGPRRGFYANNGNWFYNGYRGERNRHPGWRFYNGWWFPPAAFVGAAIGLGIANSIANSGRGNWSAHVDWCEDHYRSYDVGSNTFQPYHGPRQQCVSPYGR